MKVQISIPKNHDEFMKLIPKDMQINISGISTGKSFAIKVAKGDINLLNQIKKYSYASK